MKRITYIVLMLLIGLTASAQEYKIDQSKSAMSIKGTSNIHDWESDVESFTGSTHLDGHKIESVEFIAQVKSIKSGKSAMDNNTYEALKEEKYPEIRVASKILKWENNRLTGNIELTIAGQTKQVPVSLSLVKTNTLEVKGEVPVKMTDFGVDPPTAVWGTITTGDEIIIVFDLVLTK